MITREQLRMARAALGWGVRDLARYAGVAANTVSRYENGTDALGETLIKLRRALERKGIVFLEDDGRGAGVRSPPQQQPAAAPDGGGRQTRKSLDFC